MGGIGKTLVTMIRMKKRMVDVLTVSLVAPIRFKNLLKIFGELLEI